MMSARRLVVLACAIALLATATAQGPPCTVSHFGGGGTLNITVTGVDYLVAGNDATGDGSGSRWPDLDFLNVPWTSPTYNEAPVQGVPWQQGALPFGENVFCSSIIGDYQLPLLNINTTEYPTLAATIGEVNTDFPRDHDLFIRLSFSLSDSAPLLLTIVKDNALGGISVNGNEVLPAPTFPLGYGPGSSGASYNFNYGGCGNGLLGAQASGVSAPVYINVPQSFTQAGDNLLAIRVHDLSGVQSQNQAFFNVQISFSTGYNGNPIQHVTSPGTCVCFGPSDTTQ